ncbi:UNVERIFIED_CONTAM: hypothetical protein FKN15_040837 [Acipenser sinensis]
MLWFFPLKKLKKHFKFVFFGIVLVLGLLAAYLESTATAAAGTAACIFFVEFLLLK